MSLSKASDHRIRSSARASVALERGEMESAIKQLAGGLAWTADMLVALEQRVIALENQPGDQKKQPRFDLSDYRIQQRSIPAQRALVWGSGGTVPRADW